MKRGLLITFVFVFIFLVSLASAQTITGTVRNSTGSVIPNAVVEAWNWAVDSLITETTTDINGNYVLSSGLINGNQYTVRAFYYYNTTLVTGQCWDNVIYQGYMPKVQNVIASASNVNFALDPIPVVTPRAFFGRYSSGVSTFNDKLLRRGDVVTTKDPTGIINGVGVNCWAGGGNRGDYVLDSWRDDTSSVLLNFSINNVSAINISGSRQWSQSGGTVDLSTTGNPAQCQLISARWSQSSAVVNQTVSLIVNTSGCAGREISFTITEGGSVSQGPATQQPITAFVDFFESAITTWRAELVNDDIFPDSDPPEYYFIARMVQNVSVSVDSRTFNQYLNVLPDTVPPTISNQQINFFGENVIITWNTDEPSWGQVQYGLTTSYGSVVSNFTTLKTSHMLVINGINLDQLYHYRITSSDQSGNTQYDSDRTFTINSPVTIELQQGIFNYYFGTKDTYLYSQGDIDVGYLNDFRLGQRLDNGDFSHPILRFDVSPIPSNANIISATLETYLYDKSDNITLTQYPITGNLYRVLRDWGNQGNDGTINPGEVSWNYSFYNTVLWGQPGANQASVDRETNFQDSKTFTQTSPLGWYSWNLNESAVQGWTNTSDSVNNYGIVIKSPAITNAMRYRFYSSEHFNQTLRPKLVIIYTKGAVICPDFNKDSIINVIDLALVVYWQGKRSSDLDWNNYRYLDTDLNNVINYQDVNYVVARLGGVC